MKFEREGIRELTIAGLRREETSHFPFAD